MQRPTLQNVRIRSTRDALHVFGAVARNALPLITRRLDAEERRNIIPGNVYVWEERGANTEATGLGMERWTDGMGWGPSRVRDEFLFYHQKDSDIGDEPINPVTPWAQMMRKRERALSHSSGNLYPSMNRRRETECLIKQTYSVHVSLPNDAARGIIRKWHLTAYFSQQKLDELNTIDRIPGVGDVPVPDGWFKSARASKVRRDTVGSTSPSSANYATGLPASPPNSSYSQYRESLSPSHESSISPVPFDYPGSASSSSMVNTHVGNVPVRGGGQHDLVPLEYLQNISGQKRDPRDEQLLRLFGSYRSSPSMTPQMRPRDL